MMGTIDTLAMHYGKDYPTKGSRDGIPLLIHGRDDAYDRFEKLAQEHGRTAKQLMLEAMEIYFQEAQRLKDEKN